MKKRILRLVFALYFCLFLLPSTAMALRDSVDYLTCDETGKDWTTETHGSDTCTNVTEDTTTWSDGWYVASSTVTINDHVTVTGAVHLILTDGCNLTANGGINVSNGNSLTIYAQSAEEGIMGQLHATGGETNAAMAATLLIMAALSPLTGVL